ncbi:hypothetical protein GCM10023235_75570 [Kitasatospora terrestris]|uniref:Uncharacterized protein n=1 Tax=Kitasatospora terrestris TaxID=258051 RepID=A0ABP9EY64_9ACTN
MGNAQDPAGIPDRGTAVWGLLGRRVRGDLGRLRAYLERRGRRNGADRGRTTPA